MSVYVCDKEQKMYSLEGFREKKITFSGLQCRLHQKNKKKNLFFLF